MKPIDNTNNQQLTVPYTVYYTRTANQQPITLFATVEKVRWIKDGVRRMCIVVLSLAFIATSGQTYLAFNQLDPASAVLEFVALSNYTDAATDGDRKSSVAETMKYAAYWKLQPYELPQDKPMPATRKANVPAFTNVTQLQLLFNWNQGELLRAMKFAALPHLAEQREGMQHLNQWSYVDVTTNPTPYVLLDRYRDELQPTFSFRF